MKTFALALPFVALGSTAFASTVSEDIEASILRALMDEYQAVAIYDSYIDAFGSDTPFSKIIKAEEHHSDMLIELLNTYEIDVPSNPYLDGTRALAAVPATLEEAYQISVDAEIANIALYSDELLPTVTAYADITDVFTKLMNASQDNHLPVFSSCLEGECTMPEGHGQGGHGKGGHGEGKGGHGQGGNGQGGHGGGQGGGKGKNHG